MKKKKKERRRGRGQRYGDNASGIKRFDAEWATRRSVRKHSDSQAGQASRQSSHLSITSHPIHLDG